MVYERRIKDYKSGIADAEDTIIRMDQVLGGRGESSTINNELVIITSYYNITIDTVCSQRLINRNIK